MNGRVAFGLMFAVVLFLSVWQPASSFQPTTDELNAEIARLEGKWEPTLWVFDGKVVDERDGRHYVIKGLRIAHFKNGKPEGTASITIDPTQSPKHMNLVYDQGKLKGRVLKGIYKFDAAKLVTCFVAPGADRPKTFDSKVGSGVFLSIDRPKE